MSYNKGSNLPGQRASKLGHLDVVGSELVNEIVEKFESVGEEGEPPSPGWVSYEGTAEPCRLIFAVDGSAQTVTSDSSPRKQLSFVKTALLRLDRAAVEELDPKAPHPMALRDLLADSAMYHATAIPLTGIAVQGKRNYDTIREIVDESLKDESLGGEPYNTLKWLAYEKWNSESTRSPAFSCPHCREDVDGLDPDADYGYCSSCGGKVLLADMIGLHLDMSEDAAPEAVASAYMLVHETLLLFTGIRIFWEQGKISVLERCLFMKDGPLSLPRQYSKLVIPIRRFLEFAKKESGISVKVVGQEKSGVFVDHLEWLARVAPHRSYMIPSDEYIRERIQHRASYSGPYGERTNYGNKVLVNWNSYHRFVLTIPVGEYKDTTCAEDFVGFEEILSTIPGILSHQHEGALTPIVLADGLASLSTYPSAAVLKVFADL